VIKKFRGILCKEQKRMKEKKIKREKGERTIKRGRGSLLLKRRGLLDHTDHGELPIAIQQLGGSSLKRSEVAWRGLQS
jgi:hypothetical protein